MCVSVCFFAVIMSNEQQAYSGSRMGVSASFSGAEVSTEPQTTKTHHDLSYHLGSTPGHSRSTDQPCSSGGAKDYNSHQSRSVKSTAHSEDTSDMIFDLEEPDQADQNRMSQNRGPQNRRCQNRRCH